MKLKDYWRLAKISLKARKKTTRNTVAGIAFSLIIITPLLFAMVGLNMTINGQLNESPEQLVATFISSAKGEEIEESGHNGWRYDDRLTSASAMSDHTKYFQNASITTINYAVGTKVVDTYYEEDTTIAYKERIIIQGDDTKYNLQFEKKEEQIAESYKQVTTMAVLKEDDFAKFTSFMSQVKIKGNYKGFTGDGKRQVIVSKNYLKMAGLTPDDVFNKKISVYFEDNSNYKRTVIINDNEVDMYKINHFLFQEFEVVGVIDGQEYDYDDLRRADMIFTKASYYDSTGKAVLDSEYEQNSDKGYTIKQGDYKAKDERSKDYVFPGASYYNPRYVIQIYNDDASRWDYGNIEKNVYLYQAKSYDDLIKQTNKVFNDEYSNSYANKESFIGECTTPFVSQFQLVYKIFTIASLIGSVFGGVILFAALVNLFNSVKHSVDSRMNYLGVMKAIGAKDSTIPKLYFFEVLRIFLRAYIWILIIGSAICVGIKILVDYLTRTIDLSIVISISWATIPIVMGVLAAVLVVVGFVYSFGCTYVVSKRPITTMLED